MPSPPVRAHTPWLRLSRHGVLASSTQQQQPPWTQAVTKLPGVVVSSHGIGTLSGLGCLVGSCLLGRRKADRRLIVGWKLARVCFGRTGLYTLGVLENGTNWMNRKRGEPLWSLVDVHCCFTTYLIRFNKNMFPESMLYDEQHD